MRDGPALRPHALGLLRWPVYPLLALGLMVVAGPRTSLNPRSTLPGMVQGTAWRPYVKRALVGVVVRAGDVVIPGSAKDALSAAVERSPLLRDRLKWESAHATWFALVFAIHLASLVLFAAAFERWLARSLGFSAAWALAGGILALALLPLHFGYQNFVYDFPGLALFTLGLVLNGESRWGALALLWPIGMLNKETFVLLVPVFLAMRWGRLSGAAIARQLAVQAALTLLVVVALGIAFRANPGPPIEWHLMRNLTLHPPARQLIHDAAYWGFVVIAFLGWKRDRRLAAATLAVMAVLFGTTLFFGYLGEYRDFYEAWPLLLAMALTTARGALERGPATVAG